MTNLKRMLATGCIFMSAIAVTATLTGCPGKSASDSDRQEAEHARDEAEHNIDEINQMNVSLNSRGFFISPKHEVASLAEARGIPSGYTGDKLRTARTVLVRVATWCQNVLNISSRRDISYGHDADLQEVRDQARAWIVRIDAELAHEG